MTAERIGLMLALLASCFASRPGAARAAELRPSIGVETRFATNPFGRDSGSEVSALSLVANPRFEVESREGRLLYRLRSDTEYQIFVTQEGADFLDQVLDLSASYALGSRTQLAVQDFFSRESSIFFQSDPSGVQTEVELGQSRFWRNGLNVEVSHQFTQRLFVSAGGDYGWVDFDDNANQSDNTTLAPQFQVSYRMLPKHRVGFGGGYSYQDFGAEDLPLLVFGDPAQQRVRRSRSNIVQGFLSWKYDFDRTLDISLQGGPAYVSSRSVIDRVEVPLPGAPPVVTVTRPTSSRWTFFGALNISKRMQRWHLRLGYTRRESPGVGEGASSALDRVHARLEWAGDSWRTYVQTGYNQRSRLAQTTGGSSSSQVRQYFVSGGIIRSLTRHLRAVLASNYRRQVGSSGARARDIENFDIRFQLRYEFAPIAFGMP